MKLQASVRPGWLGAGCLAVAALHGNASALTVCPAAVQSPCVPPCEVRVSVLVSGRATLQAVGFDFLFDNSSASLTGWERGRLVRNWQGFERAMRRPGALRIGGFDPTGAALDGTDTLVVLLFQVTASNPVCFAFETRRYVDDLSGAVTCAGSVPIAGGFSDGGTIRVSPQGSHACCYPTPDGTLLDVRAWLPREGSYQGAAFRIEFSPPVPEARLEWTADPSLGSSTGNPIDNTAAPGDSSGIVVRFPTCLSRWVQPEIVLGTIRVHGLAGVHDLFVKRDHRERAGCAWLESCDECGSPACLPQAEGGDDPVVFQARLNGDCRDSHCPGVESLAWSKLKQLYR
jgi:hypothetical protein